MTNTQPDDRVDELLADLDRALAVEPSPAVAARVRTRMEAAPSGWLGWRWSVAAASVVVVAAAVYLAWPQPSTVGSDAVQIASGAPATGGPQPSAQLPNQAVPPAASPVAAPPVAAPAMRHANAEAAGPRRVRHTTPDVREPEVLVSPNQRLALEQLAVAVRDGRLTAESVAAASQPIVQEPVIVPSMAIAPFEADVLPAIGTSVTVSTGSGVIRRLARVATSESADR